MEETNEKQMNVQRALIKLKTTRKKIDKLIDKKYVSYVVGTSKVLGYNSNDDFKNEAKTNYQAMADLKNYYIALKTAIVLSNATTIVKIAGKEMTVAEAIERKNDLENEKRTIFKLKNEYYSILSTIESINVNNQKLAEEMTKTIAGKDSKISEDDIKKLKKVIEDFKQPSIIEGFDTRKEIDKVEEELALFEQEVDIILTESNVRTIITIN